MSMYVVKVYSNITGDAIGYAGHPTSNRLAESESDARKFATAADAFLFCAYAFPRQWPHHTADPVPVTDSDFDGLVRLVDFEGNAVDRTPIRLASGAAARGGRNP